MFLRTDRIAQFGVRYFMGMQGYTFAKYMALIDKYSQQHPGEPEGALIIFADDAEYVGTNGWFRLKYENKPDNTFEHTPASRQKLIDLVAACRKRGSFCTFDEACRLPPNAENDHFRRRLGLARRPGLDLGGNAHGAALAAVARPGARASCKRRSWTTTRGGWLGFT